MMYYIELMLPLHVSVVKPPSSGGYHMLQLPYASEVQAVSYVIEALTFLLGYVSPLSTILCQCNFLRAGQF
jgi:hypothetical protein